MNAIPKVSSWSEFNEITYSELQSLKNCIFKSLSRNLSLTHQLPELPPNRSALLGKFYHKTMELVLTSASIQDLRGFIEREIVNLQSEVDKWPQLKAGAVSGWPEVNFYATTATRQYKERIKTPSKAVVGTERKLVSKEKSFSGRIDNFFINEKTAHLRELKTAKLRTPDGKVRLEYEEQLKFYSILLFDNFEIDLVEASLMSPYEESYGINISREIAESFRKQTLSFVDSINAKIRVAKKISDLANPDKEYCGSCTKRPICSVFLRRQFDLGLEYDSFILDGIVDAIENHQSEKVNSVQVMMASNDKKTLLLVPKSETSCLSLGKRFLFTDLDYRDDGFHWSQKTRVFAND